MEEIGWFILILLFSYFCGSFSIGFLIAEKKGIDIQKVGSKATGATNVSRALGFKWGFLTFVLDIIKGGLPVFFATLVLDANWMIFCAAILTILGHIFPYQLSFKGGKGVSCLIGILLVLNLKVTLFWGLTWFLIFLILLFVIRASKASFSEKMAANNLLTIWYLPVFFWFGFHSLDWVLFAVILIGIIYFAHRENIKRIIKTRVRRIS